MKHRYRKKPNKSPKSIFLSFTIGYKTSLSITSKIFIYLFLLSFTTLACNDNSPNKPIKTQSANETTLKLRQEEMQKRKASTRKPVETKQRILCELETRLLKYGLVNIKDVDSTIIVDLKYSSTDNFINTDVYGDLKNCYLQPAVAEQLKQAHDYLKKQNPNYRFKVWDGARPLSVQKLFWDKVDKPESLKHLYIARPDSNLGSIHNYGCGVDLTIVDSNGNELDMGTAFDHFSILAYPSKEEELLIKGVLPKKVVDNRKLLRNSMKHAGFFPANSEWWHFSAMTRKQAKAKYKIVK